MFFIFCYIFLYCNIDALLNRFYLSKFDMTSFESYNIIIQTNKEFFYSLITINKFVLSIYGFYIFYFLCLSKNKNIYSLALAFIYSKYTLNIFISDNINLIEYEYSRIIMWAFATPIMLKLYCDANYLELKDIKFLYHFIPCILNVVIYPLKNNLIIYYTYTCLSLVPMFLFMKQLLSLQREKFTKIFFCIWSMFIILHIIDIVKLVDIYNLNIMYLTADMIGKVTTTFIMHDNIEQQYTMKNNSDLQCINFISFMMNKIKKI